MRKQDRNVTVPESSLFVEGLKRNPVIVVLFIMMDLMILTIAFKAFASDTEVNNLEGKLQSVQIEVDSLSDTTQTIQTDVAVIKNDQQHVKDQLKEQREDLKRVLQILESRNN